MPLLNWDELITAEDAQLFYQIAIKGRDELGLAPDPRTGLEMTLLRMLAFRPASAESGSSWYWPPEGGQTGGFESQTGAASQAGRGHACNAASRRAGTQMGSVNLSPELFSSPCRACRRVDQPASCRDIISRRRRLDVVAG